MTFSIKVTLALELHILERFLIEVNDRYACWYQDVNVRSFLMSLLHCVTRFWFMWCIFSPCQVANPSKVALYTAQQMSLSTYSLLHTTEFRINKSGHKSKLKQKSSNLRQVAKISGIKVVVSGFHKNRCNSFYKT